MKKTHSIIMVPTHESPLYIFGGFYREVLHYYNGTPFQRNRERSPQHLYAVSDDEVVAGDWVINSYTQAVWKTTSTDAIAIKKIASRTTKKIIATTNAELSDVLKFDSDFLIEFVEQQSVWKADAILIEYEVLEGELHQIKTHENNTIVASLMYNPYQKYTKEEVKSILESLKLYDGGEMQSMQEMIHNSRFNNHIDEYIKKFME